MSRAHKTRRSAVIVSLVVLWVATTHGAVKPRDPNTAKATKPTPQKVAATQARGAQSPKMVANMRPARPLLENPATFTPDMPFGRAIEILRNCVYPPVNIVVLWRDVEDKAGIDRNTPIGLDGVPGLRIRQYIELLLRSVSAGSSAELGYALDSGVILVATKTSLPKPKMETRVYDISDLAAPPSTGMPMMMPMQMMSPFGIGSSMQPSGNYGAGRPYGGSGPGVGYPQGSVNNAPRTSTGPVVFGS